MAEETSRKHHDFPPARSATSGGGHGVEWHSNHRRLSTDRKHPSKRAAVSSRARCDRSRLARRLAPSSGTTQTGFGSSSSMDLSLSD